MATSSSFKQQCPSCEAMVPVRDPGLVGKKIDCPKCKYRFVVEEPAPEEDEDLEESGGKGKGKSTAVTDKKGKGKGVKRLRDDTVAPDEDEGEQGKKAPNPKMLYIGVGLGVVALVALIGGGILLFGGSKPQTQGGGGGAAGGRPATSTTPGVVSIPTNNPPAEPPPSDAPLDDLTNLLPNATALLYKVDMDRVQDSSGFRAAMLEGAGAFTEGAFQKTFNCPLSSLKTVLTAVLPKDKEKPEEREYFSILRFDKPLNSGHVKTTLKLTALPAVNGLDSFTVNGDLDSLTAAFVRFASPSAEKFTLHFLDEQTVVFADPAPMKTFLEEKRMPRRLTQPPPPLPESGSPGAPAAAQGIPGGAIKPGSIKPGAVPPGAGRNSADGTPRNREILFQAPPNPPKPGQLPVTPAPPNAPPPNAPPPNGPAPNAPVPNSPATPPPPPAGGDAANGGAEAEPTASTSYMTVDPSIKVAMDRLDMDKTPTILYFAALTKYFRLIPPELISDSVVDRGQAEKYLILSLESQDEPKVVAVALHVFEENKIAGMFVWQTEKAEAARVLKAVIDGVAQLIAQKFKSALDMDIGVNTAPPGTPQPGGGPMFRRPPGIQNLSPPPGAAPNATAAATKNAGSITTWIREKTIAATVELDLKNAPREVYTGIRDAFRAGMVQLKGRAELVANRPRVHELARALQAYVKAHGSFPRGAMQRAPNAERNINWYPDQRLSWMVELLPYLGEGEFANLKRDPDKLWMEDDNRLTAQVVIPQFLSPGDPEHARVHYPGKFGHFATTRFVGVAGLGLDAATYASGNAAVAKKLGVFGYDRVTKPEEIRDDPESTILLLQIPSGQISPWMSGGGSTVRGVPEGDDAVKPFVSAEYMGKKGTFAVMADFKVRFIFETIKPATFRAMCTIAGGELIDDINEVAPVVPEESITSELKAQPLAGGATPPAEAKPEAPAATAVPPATTPPAATQPAAAPKAPLSAGWKEVVDEAAGYAVALPEGSVTPGPVPELPGVAGSKSTAVVAKTDGTNYVAGHLKLAAAVQPSDVKRIFDGFRGKLHKDGKISAEKPVQLDGVSGMEWVALDPTSVTSVTRCYVVNDEVYYLMAAGPRTDPKELATFFNSFRLLKK